ncbi:MAG: hypothetical protein Q9201_003887 [Fulgogasparrea decipioides]
MAPGLRKRAVSVLRGRSSSVSSQNSRPEQSGLTDDEPPAYGSDPSLSKKEDVSEDASSNCQQVTRRNADDSVVMREHVGRRSDEPAVLEDYVRICPHENLTFSRLQAITTLPGFKDSCQGVPAITEASDKCHKVTGSGSAGWWDKCSCVGEIDEGKAIGQAEHSLQHVHWSKQYSGVQLKSVWYLWLDKFPEEFASPQGVQKLCQTHLLLCPHWELIDWITPELVIRALKYVPQETDPVTADRVQNKFSRSGYCSCCHTVFDLDIHIHKQYLRVSSHRLLGKAQSAKDPVWLSQ